MASQVYKHHKFTRVRLEGFSLWKMLSNPVWSINYTKKYAFNRLSQSPSVIDWFDHQRTVVRERVNRPEEGGDEVILAMVGDIMWIKRNWGDYYSNGIEELLHSFDGVVGNLETPMDSSQKVPNSFWKDVVKFNAHPNLLSELERDGISPFAALSIANNHSYDKGEKGLLETMKQLDAMGIGHSGATTAARTALTHTFERGSIRFGFYGATYGFNDPHYRAERVFINIMKGIIPPVDMEKVDISGAEAAIDEMVKNDVDVKIINIHWGNEFELYPDPTLLNLGKKLIEMGFDVVMGNHPHVVQPSQVCFVNERLEDDKGCSIRTPDGHPRRGIIYYSLGNFATAMLTPMTRIGVIQQLSFARRGSRVEWYNPKHTFVVNSAPGRTGDGLMLVKEWERSMCVSKSKISCMRVRSHLKYLENHLTGKEDKKITRQVKKQTNYFDLIF